jgi:hypothetical protein
MNFGKKQGRISREKESLSQIMDSFIVRDSAKGKMIILAGLLALFCLSTTAFGVGSISGYVVRHSDNTPLQGVSIQALQGKDENIADERAWGWAGSAQTDSSGFYQITGLAQRRYRVHIYDQDAGGTHYVDADIYNVQVFTGADTPDMNFKLRQAAKIWGYVKAANGIPIPDVEVIADAFWTHQGWDWINAFTDENGYYELWVLPSPGKFYPVWVRNAMLPGKTYKVYGGGVTAIW